MPSGMSFSTGMGGPRSGMDRRLQRRRPGERGGGRSISGRPRRGRGVGFWGHSQPTRATHDRWWFLWDVRMRHGSHQALRRFHGHLWTDHALWRLSNRDAMQRQRLREDHRLPEDVQRSRRGILWRHWGLLRRDAFLSAHLRQGRVDMWKGQCLPGSTALLCPSDLPDGLRRLLLWDDREWLRQHACLRG